MCPKFVYQHQNRPSPWVWRDLLLCHLSKTSLAKSDPDELICQFVLNVKMCNTKVTEVSFETSKCCKISKWCHWQSDLGNPNSATNDRITFHLWLCSKLVSPIILHLHPKMISNVFNYCLFLTGQFGKSWHWIFGRSTMKIVKRINNDNIINENKGIIALKWSDVYSGSDRHI